MPRTCSICTHSDYLAVEDALRAQISLRTIATRWSVSKAALLRHRERHRPAQAPVGRDGPPRGRPAAVPHSLPACAAAILGRCRPEVRQRYEDAATSLERSLDDCVVRALHEFVQHLDQCPHYLAGPEA
jgi:hypothetical protein